MVISAMKGTEQAGKLGTMSGVGGGATIVVKLIRDVFHERRQLS